MSEIKALLASLDAMRDSKQEHLDYALHNAYPTLRAHIERLERIEAAYVECGGQLTEQGEPKLTHLTRVAEAGRVLAEAIENADRRITQNGADLAVYDALSAYLSATRDITSKEKEV